MKNQVQWISLYTGTSALTNLKCLSTLSLALSFFVGKDQQQQEELRNYAEGEEKIVLFMVGKAIATNCD